MAPGEMRAEKETSAENTKGDLALRREVAHGWRLGRRVRFSCGNGDPFEVESIRFPVGGNAQWSRAIVFLVPLCSFTFTAAILLVYSAERHSQ